MSISSIKRNAEFGVFGGCLYAMGNINEALAAIVKKKRSYA
jgi:hypothetical protein